jgi:hypothetical protein
MMALNMGRKRARVDAVSRKNIGRRCNAVIDTMMYGGFQVECSGKINVSGPGVLYPAWRRTAVAGTDALPFRRWYRRLP